MPRGRARRLRRPARADPRAARRSCSRSAATPATSMNEVAEACGMSKPTLYHYYATSTRCCVEHRRGPCRRGCEALVAEVERRSSRPRRSCAELIGRFVEEYADAQHAHRVLTEDVKFLEPSRPRARARRRARASSPASRDAVAALRPDLTRAAARQAADDAAVRHDQLDVHLAEARRRARLTTTMAPVVADLFLGGLSGAVEAPPARRRDRPCIHCHQPHNGDNVMNIAQDPRRAGRRAAAPPPRRTPTSTSASRVSATGPAASLGIPEKNTIALMPQDDRRPEGQLHRARRRDRHDGRGRQHAQADHREQGRRRHRLDRPRRTRWR